MQYTGSHVTLYTVFLCGYWRLDTLALILSFPSPTSLYYTGGYPSLFILSLLPPFIPSRAWRHALVGTIAWPAYHEAQLQASISDLRTDCELQSKNIHHTCVHSPQGIHTISCLPQQHLVQPLEPSIFEVCVLRLKTENTCIIFDMVHAHIILSHSLTHGLILLAGCHSETVG